MLKTLEAGDLITLSSGEVVKLLPQLDVYFHGGQLDKEPEVVRIRSHYKALQLIWERYPIAYVEPWETASEDDDCLCAKFYKNELDSTREGVTLQGSYEAYTVGSLCWFFQKPVSRHKWSAVNAHEPV